jgi:hypothetical protein
MLEGLEEKQISKSVLACGVKHFHASSTSKHEYNLNSSDSTSQKTWRFAVKNNNRSIIAV